jgi:hypothetical protein
LTRENKRWTYWVAIGVTVLGGISAITFTTGAVVTQVDSNTKGITTLEKTFEKESKAARKKLRELRDSVIELRGPLKRIDDLVWELRQLRLQKQEQAKPHQ